MHRTPSIAIALLATLGTISGCGSPSAATGDAQAGAKSKTASPNSTSGAPQAPSDPVAQVVHGFLEAVRVADVETSSSLLTPLALQRTNEHDLCIAPLGSATASFQVGKTEMIDADKAFVESVWTDLDVDGNPTSEELVWALRRGDQGWRISGLAIQVAGGEPQLIDFENPTEVIANSTTSKKQADNQPADTNASPPVQTAQDPFQSSSAR